MDHTTLPEDEKKVKIFVVVFDNANNKSQSVVNAMRLVLFIDADSGCAGFGVIPYFSSSCSQQKKQHQKVIFYDFARPEISNRFSTSRSLPQ